MCGQDQKTGYDFEHRRQWIVDRMLLLGEVFTIDICAYAVMSNHYHVVLHVDAHHAKSLSDGDVAARWLRIFTGPPWVRRWVYGVTIDAHEQRLLDQWLNMVRSRLCDISWFMRCLNEPIARMANAEDDCTGRFWEGRFKSQALLDEAALLRCMAYVDLNPIRAGMAQTPESSDYTAIQRRIKQPDDKRLMTLGDTQPDRKTLPVCFLDYLELVDWSGRAMLAGKGGTIPNNTPPILTRLGIESDRFLDSITEKPVTLASAVGSLDALRQFAKSVGLKFIRSGIPAPAS
ncbi:MAG TPA: hypothetical protein VJ984_02355 [Xanthomonadales bacterium]|nr:hypothetical protein [Xanthomonadales bacterium]